MQRCGCQLITMSVLGQTVDICTAGLALENQTETVGDCHMTRTSGAGEFKFDLDATCLGGDLDYLAINQPQHTGV